MFGDNGFFTDKFAEFWIKRYQEVQDSPIIISGIGFDPRSMQSAQILQNNGLAPKLIPIDFSVTAYGDTDKNLEQATKNNTALLHEFDTLISPIGIDMFDYHGRPIGGRKIVNEIYNLRKFFLDEIDVILDVGGLPRSLFGPLLCYLLEARDSLGFKNLHVASLPNENLDAEIISDEILPPSNMFGFDSYQSEDKLVWIPIIGKNDSTRLRLIYSKIEKNCVEICPVLPFRPNNPRQVDNLLLDLHDVLFNEIKTIYNNITYIAHNSPFLVYREIVNISDYYSKLLGDLPGDVKVLITPLDDKTSCVGAMLAATTKGLPVMYADTVSYRVKNSDCLLKKINSEPLEIWVSGDAYDT